MRRSTNVSSVKNSVVAVLVNETLSSVYVILTRGISPPISDIAILVKLTACV